VALSCNNDSSPPFWFVGREPPILATPVLISVTCGHQNYEKQVVHGIDAGNPLNPDKKCFLPCRLIDAAIRIIPNLGLRRFPSVHARDRRNRDALKTGS